MNTLRSTVRSNRKERGGRGGEGQEKGAEDTGDVSMSHRSRKSAMSPSHISSKVSLGSKFAPCKCDGCTDEISITQIHP